jgi:hypothetical protein
LTTKTDSIELIDERIKSQQWKLKETCMHFLFRIFQKYGNPDFVDESSKPISQHVSENYAEGLVDLSMTLISQSQDIFIYSKVLNFCLKIISTGFNHACSVHFIKPHVETILSQYAIPLMLLTEKDIEDFESDPIEFVRKSSDSTASFYSAKSTVLDLITQATRYKINPKDEESMPVYLEYFFKYCLDNLGEYINQESPDYRIKDSLLQAIGQMSTTLIRYPQFHANIEGVLKECVFSDFSGDNEFLKYRACWIYGEFSRMPMDSDHRFEIGKALFSAMSDHNLPVKITSSSSLYRMLRNKDLKESFKSELARILEAYISLMDSIDNDELISGLEEIVSIYDDSIEPFAIEL